ncbi:MAG: hypothetical protein SPJ28_06305, partial [Oscillospiraceae bacterium]|nr:hypothetical protein [Oscillospiraceae bacterium]
KLSANTLLSIICLFHLSNKYFSNPQCGIWTKKERSDPKTQIKAQRERRNKLSAQKCQNVLAHSL